MTNITENVASKFTVALIAIAMMFSAFAPVSQAQTTEELQAMINDLLAQVAALQSDVPASAGAGSTSSASFCPYTWTRDLSSGSTGDDVMKLQQFLNSDADTTVSASGAGSKGMETMYYGPATAAAVSKFQVKYAAEILTPINLSNPTGYFGSGSRAKANALCVTSAEMDDEEMDDEEMDDEDMDDEMMELSGEGDLDTFEIDDAPDTDIPEGSEDEVIAELTIEATDGDLELDRITFVLDAATSTDEQDPWETFETISLWVDGDMIAEFDASDEDEYLEEDDGEFRFSGLELFLPEDEEVEVLVGATIMSSVDGVDDDTDAAWNIAVTDVRYFDADGVSEDEDSFDEIGASEGVDFDIVVEGDGEELTFSLGSNNPDSTDIIVDTDQDTDDVTVLEYTLEAEDADVEINTLFVDVETSTTSSLVIDDVSIEIDGEIFDAENSPVSNSNTTKFEFDVDGDIVIDEGEEVTVVVMVDFRAQESSNNVDRYSNGTTIEASADVDSTDAEGADDILGGDLNGSAVGEEHTLVAEGIVVPVDAVEFTTDTTGDNDQTGSFSIDFEVTAVEGDFYIFERATNGATTTGVSYTVEGPNGATTTVSGTLSSTADQESSDFFAVREGETETFTLTVTVDTNTTGQHRVALTGVGFSDDEIAGDADDETYTPTPAQDFRTSFININAN